MLQAPAHASGVSAIPDHSVASGVSVKRDISVKEGHAGKMPPGDPVSLSGAGTGWRARLQLQFSVAGGRTVLSRRQHEGPLMVQRPFHPEGPVCHVYVLHPPAGIVGGDELRLQAQLDAGAHALITTPGATRFYRSAGACARLDQQFRLAPGAALEWLPQDNIFFPATQARLETSFELAPGARLLAWEGLCFGRPAMHEHFAQGRVRTRLSVQKNGELLLHERLQITGPDLFALADRPLCATALAYPADEALLTQVRAWLDAIEAGFRGSSRPMLHGATLLDDLLVVRLLDDDNLRLQYTLQRLWLALRPQVMQREPCLPRIWAT